MLRFGPFRLDQRTWTLSREEGIIDLAPRLVELLAHLASHPGATITREDLIERFWPDIHITENTLTRAISDIRKAIDDSAETPIYIQTLARRGYRFVGEPSGGGAGSGPDPFRDWVDGRLALESLEESRLPDAVAAFERAAAELPKYAPAHAGLANACLLTFEKSRIDGLPDPAAIRRGIISAQAAVTLDPALGEGWATLGHLLTLASDVENARAAARHAVAVEPGNWRHHFRLAFATWGEERLRAVDRTLALMPGCAAAHFLSTMVFIARGAYGLAEQQADAGAAVQGQQSGAGSLPGAGLYWLQGLLRLTANMGRPSRQIYSVDEIKDSFAREITAESTGRLYAREFATNARVSGGFIRLNMGDVGAATEAFRSVLAVQPTHPRALLGQAIAAGGGPLLLPLAEVIEELKSAGRTTDAALVGAALLAARGDAAAGVAALDQFVAQAPSGSAGWIIPVDPMLANLRSAPAFDTLLARLSSRAA